MPVIVADILLVVSPLIVIIGALLGASRWFWHRFERKLNEGHNSTLLRLDSIDLQMKRLNSCWNAHDRRIARIEGAIFKMQQPDDPPTDSPTGGYG